MDKRAVGKHVAVVAGLGVIGVFVIAFACWKDVVEQYYLHWLRKNPRYFHQLFERPEGTAERKAVHEFLSGADGTKELLSALIACYPTADCDDLSRQYDMGFIGFNGVDPTDVADQMWFWCRLRHVYPGGEGIFGGRPCKCETRIVRALCELLKEVQHREVTLTEYPKYSFVILPLEEGSALYLKDMPPNNNYYSLSGYFPYACLIRRKQSE